MIGENQSTAQPWPGLDDNDPQEFFQLTANNGLPKNPVLIQQAVEKFLGGKIIEGIPEAQGKTYALRISNKKHQKTILDLTKIGDTECKVIRHPTRNFNFGAITCRDAADHSIDYLENALKNQRVVKVERLSKWEDNQVKMTNTYRLKVNGPLPSHVHIGFIRCETRKYFPDPTCCKKCYNFGHTEKYCKQEKAKCGVCSGEHKTKENETLCNNANYCDRCKTDSHQIRHRSCPQYKKEKEILRIKVNEDISFTEAKNRYQRNQKNNKNASYAEIAKHQTPNGNTMKEITDLLAKQQEAFLKGLTELSQQFNKKLEDQAKIFNERVELQNQIINKLTNTIEEKNEELALEKQRCERIIKLNEKYSLAITKLSGVLDDNVNLEDPSTIQKNNIRLETQITRANMANAVLRDKIGTLKKQLKKLNAPNEQKNSRTLSSPELDPPAKKPTMYTGSTGSQSPTPSEKDGNISDYNYDEEMKFDENL